MAFSIKNDEADELVRELTALTGESLTTAVTESVRERLERKRRARDAELRRKEAAIDRIVADFQRNRLRPELVVVDDDFLYDERGLPH